MTRPRRFAAAQNSTLSAPGAALASKPTPKPRKYRNQPVEVDGVRFDSKREAQRYQSLMVAYKAGRISDLELQVRFDLHAPNGDLIGRYVADFTYRLVAPGMATHGRLFVEDAKGVRTPLYRWKKKHFEAEYGLRILEV
jgi:hypothetical protein